MGTISHAGGISNTQGIFFPLKKSDAYFWRAEHTQKKVWHFFRSFFGPQFESRAESLESPLTQKIKQTPPIKEGLRRCWKKEEEEGDLEEEEEA